MLATITDYKQKISLIQNSGIQFLDFALKPECNSELPNKFVRKSANGPLLRLNYHEHNGKYSLMVPGAAPEIVKPEFSFSLEQSLKLLNKIWLPCLSCALIRRALSSVGRIIGPEYKF